MNLTAHLLRKDIRRSRGLLIAWLLLLVLQGVLVSSGANPGDPIAQMAYSMISAAVPVFKALLLIVIVPFVVQDEPLVGTTAFWLTRPISRLTLLREKALYAAVVLVLPALAVELIVLAANGFTPHDLGLAALEILLGQLETIAIIAVFAALTPTFGMYAIAGAAGVIAWLVAALVIQLTGMYWHGSHVIEQVMNPSMAKSSSVAVGVTATCVCILIAAHQYLRGRTFRSIVGGCAGIAVIFAVQSLWTWDFLLLPTPKTSAPPFDESAVQIALASGVSAQDIADVRGQGAARKEIWARIEPSGVPSTYSLQAKFISPHLRAPDGSKLEVDPPQNMQMGMELNTDALVAALGGTPVSNSENWHQGGSENAPLFTLDAGTYKKHYEEPLKFSADIRFIVSNYKITSETPLAMGARFDKGSRHTVITEVLNEPYGVDVVLRERKPNLLFDRANSSSGFMQEFFLGYKRVYVLRNKKRNEAVVQRRGNFNFSFDQMLGQSRLLNQAVRISFGSEPSSKGSAPELTPEWLAGAELIRLDLTPVFEFSKTVVEDGLKMNGKP